jgi:hypothetical protein
MNTNKYYPYFALGAALVLSICSAILSVSGIQSIFIAGGIIITFIGIAIETGRVLLIYLIHKFFDEYSIKIRVIGIIFIILASLYNCVGVFSYFNSAFSTQLTNISAPETKIEVIDNEVKTINESNEQLRLEIESINKTLDQRRSALDTLNNDKDGNRTSQQQKLEREISSYQAQISSRRKEITNNNNKKTEYLDQYVLLKAEVLDKAPELQRFKYIGQAIGVTDNTKLILLITILICIIFDPTAIFLIILANNLTKINKTKIKEDNGVAFLEEQVIEPEKKTESIPESNNTFLFNKIELDEPINIDEPTTFTKPIQPFKEKILCINSGKMYNNIGEAAVDTNCDANEIMMSLNDNVTIKGYQFKRVKRNF